MKKALYLAVAMTIALFSNAQSASGLRTANPHATTQDVALKNGVYSKAPIQRVLSPSQLASAKVMTAEQFEAAKAAKGAGMTQPQKAVAQKTQETYAFETNVRGLKAFPTASVRRDKTPSRLAPAAQSEVIETPPEGTTKYYTRSGYAFLPSYGYVDYVEQYGHITIVECANNEVYIQDPVMNFKKGTWVKGIKSGNTITVATHQPLTYSPDYNATASLRWATVSSIGEMTPVDDTADHFTFTISGDKISLEGTSEKLCMGVVWDDNDEGTGCGDFKTVWTHDPEYVPTGTDPVVPPEDMKVLSWFARGGRMTMGSSGRFKGPINIGFVGDEVYVQGLINEFPEAWIKGKIEGNVATFPMLQYTGEYYDQHTWAIGMYIEDNQAYMDDFRMSYDAATQTFTALNELLCNASDTEVAYVEWVKGLQIMPEDPYAKPAEIPYFNSLETEEQMDEFDIIDTNGDKLTWSYRTGEGASYVNNNSPYDANDWLITRGFELKSNLAYHFAFKVRASGYTETLEVKMGKAPTVEAMTLEVIPRTDFENTDFEVMENERITVHEDGVYYFGIHAMSGAEEYAIYLNSVKVDEGLLPTSPKAVENFEYAPAADASNKATMTFDAPTRDISGNALNIQTGGAMTIKIWRNDVLVKTMACTPGTKGLSYTDEVPVAGNYEYKVMAYMGQVRGEKVLAGSWIGLDIPATVTNIKLIDNTTSITGVWDKVSDKGEHGGIVFPDKTTYNFCNVDEYEFWGTTLLIVGSPINTEPIADTEFTFDKETCEGVQRVEHYAVQAENASGKNTGEIVNILMGTPYQMTMREPFNSSMRYYWNYQSSSYFSGAYLSNDPSDGDSGNLEFYSGADFMPQNVTFESGKIAITGTTNPAIIFDAKKDGYSDETFKVLIQTNGMKDPVEVANLNLTKQYETYKVMLSDYKDAEWFRFFVSVDIEAAGIVSMDNLIITDLLKNNASIDVSAPEYINLGESAKVKAVVTNGGEQDVEGYSVKFYAGDVLLKEYGPSETAKLVTGREAEYEATYETSVFDEAGGNVVIRAELVYNDVKADDNVAETTLMVFVPKSTPVESVEANANIRMMEVKWGAPENTISEYVETFESYDGNTIYEDGEYLGQWKAVDVSKGSCYGWSSSSIKWPYTWQVYAFGLVDIEASNLEAGAGHKAFSGKNTLAFFSETNAETDDDQQSDRWLISPELPGMAQTLMFNTCIFTNAYGAETFEVLASSTDTELESFTKLADYSELATGWKTRLVDLPEGTKYFAIRYTTNCAFGLFIDDIRYTNTNLVPSGYNIYLDGVKVGTAEGDATEFVYNEGVDMSVDHIASVTALYGIIESAPVSAKIGVLGIETITADDSDAEAVYYNISGVQVPATSLTPGIYVRLRGDKADKVIVK